MAKNTQRNETSVYTRQVKELNTYVKTYIAPSKIHGVGVFALQNIPKGAVLFADMLSKVYTLPYDEFHRLRPPIKDYLLERWPQILNGSKFIYPDTRIQAFANHSDDPNYDAVNDIMLGDVIVGEEITENYRKIKGNEKIYT